MKNFANIEDYQYSQIEELLSHAAYLKENRYNKNLANKVMAGMFFNPSTRTRTSFELAMSQQGGHFIPLEIGGKSWGIDIDEGMIMDGENEEHLKEAVKVLEQYTDCIGVRCFPKFKDWQYDRQDMILKNMLKWSSNPVINMETVTHPCQALAMLMTMKEVFGELKNRKFVLSWSYHPKGLNTAVGNSALVATAMAGMDVTVVNPPDYDLDEKYINLAKSHAAKNNANFVQFHKQDEAIEGADFVYVKSWGSLKHYGNFDAAIQSKYKNWIMTSKKMELTNDGFLSHCLPVRRNVVIADDALDSSNSLIYQEAGNRLHVQKAILNYLLGNNNE